MMRITELAHFLLQHVLKTGDWALDATVGNGHDTLFLAEQVGTSGRVFGFDVQEAALTAARDHLQEHINTELYLKGHECLAETLPDEAHGQLTAIMFNLGYLPGGDKSVITSSETTLLAIRQGLDYLRSGGVMTIMLYPGHDGGRQEASRVTTFAENLPKGFTTMRHQRLGAETAPMLLTIAKR